MNTKIYPLVSIIIPVYNVEQYLRECLDSVVNQTLEDIEIICVNDGSTDNSEKILEEYAAKDKRIKIINQQNSGLPVARNVGMDKSTGKYIFFLDSDDYLISNDVLEKLYREIKNTDVDFLITKIKVYTESNDEKFIKYAKTVENDHNNFVKDINKITDKNFADYFNKCYITSCGRLYRSSFLKNNNIYHINKKIFFEDHGFFVKLFSAMPNIQFTEIYSFVYRLRDKSIVTSNINNDDYVQTCEKIVLEDAYNYIINKWGLIKGLKLIYKIRTSKQYAQLYSINIPNLFFYCHGYCLFDIRLFNSFFTILWNDNYRVLKLFFMPLYREKKRDGFHVIKIAGIQIYKKPLTENAK